MKKTILAVLISCIYTQQSYALGLGNDNPIVDAGVGVTLTLLPTISTEINPSVSITPTLNTNIEPTINVNPNVVVSPTVNVSPNLKLSPKITSNINNDVVNDNNSTANAQSNQSQSNDNSNSNNSSQSITVEGDSTVYKQARIPVASALAPTNLPTALCMGSSSGAFQSTLFGFSLGSSWTDKNCMVLEQVRSAANVLNDQEVAEQIMCSLKEYKEAREKLNRPCK